MDEARHNCVPHYDENTDNGTSSELESRRVFPSKDTAKTDELAFLSPSASLSDLSPRGEQGPNRFRDEQGGGLSSGDEGSPGLWAWVPRRVPRIVGRGIIPQAFDASGPLVEGVTIHKATLSFWGRIKALWNRRRRGRWDALSHPLIRPLAQLPAESFVGLLFWTSLSNFLRCIYWLQLQAGGPTWQLLFLGYLFVPGFVLGQDRLRQGLARNPLLRALLIAGGVVGIGGSSEGLPMTMWTIALAGAAAAMLSLYVSDALWTTSASRRRRAGFGMAGGLMLLQVLQFSFAGRNPLLARSWALVLLGVIPGAWVAALILYEDLAGWEAGEQDACVGAEGGRVPLGRGGKDSEDAEDAQLLGDLEGGSAVLSDDWDNDSLDERRSG